jgi:hypothetical protein
MANINKFEAVTWDGSFARRPSLFNSSPVLSANTAKSFSIPTDVNSNYAQRVQFSANCDFWVMPILAAEENMVTNGTFASDTGWTKGTGWTIAAGVATATGAISTALTQTSPVTLIEGKKYSVVFTVSGFAAGTVAVSLGGGSAGTSRGSDATFTETITAGSTQEIAFTGSGFTGNIDTVTITPIAVVPVTDHTTGGAPDFNPTGYLLGGKVTKMSLISAAGGTVGMSFYM